MPGTSEARQKLRGKRDWNIVRSSPQNQRAGPKQALSAVSLPLFPFQPSRCTHYILLSFSPYFFDMASARRLFHESGTMSLCNMHRLALHLAQDEISGSEAWAEHIFFDVLQRIIITTFWHRFLYELH